MVSGFLPSKLSIHWLLLDYISKHFCRLQLNISFLFNTYMYVLYLLTYPTHLHFGSFFLKLVTVVETIGITYPNLTYQGWSSVLWPKTLWTDCPDDARYLWLGKSNTRIYKVVHPKVCHCISIVLTLMNSPKMGNFTCTPSANWILRVAACCVLLFAKLGGFFFYLRTRHRP